MTECITETFLTRVKNDQKSLGIVARPGALFCDALEQRQAFLFRTAKPGDAGHHFDRQRQGTDHVFVETHGQTGINEIRIELENLAVMIYCVIAVFESREVAAFDRFLKRSLQSLNYGQPIKGLYVFRILF